MDIQDMRIFARVSAVQNLSAVGTELGLTPGTISKRIQSLEDELSARLFDRTTRSIRITEEGAEIMEEYKGSPALDAGLLAAAQAVEHYEISRYGTLIAWAEELGLEDAVSLLEDTLEEEKATDEALTEIAKSAINQQAEAA